MSLTTRVAHVPGPWSVVERYDGSRTIAILRDFRPVSPGLHVEAAVDWVGRGSPDQIFANARLIAIAPDLLAAGRALLKASNAYRVCVQSMPDRGTVALYALEQAHEQMALAIGRASGILPADAETPS